MRCILYNILHAHVIIYSASYNYYKPIGMHHVQLRLYIINVYFSVSFFFSEITLLTTSSHINYEKNKINDYIK